VACCVKFPSPTWHYMCFVNYVSCGEVVYSTSLHSVLCDDKEMWFWTMSKWFISHDTAGLTKQTHISEQNDNWSQSFSRLRFKTCLSKTKTKTWRTKTKTQRFQEQDLKNTMMFKTIDRDSKTYKTNTGKSTTNILTSRKSIHVRYSLFGSISQYSCTQLTTKHHAMLNNIFISAVLISP